MSKAARTAAWTLCVWFAAGAGASLHAQGQTAGSAPGPLAVGAAAPNVDLLFGGKTMSLKNLLAGNRTAVIFYPKACSSCDEELKAADKAALQRLGELGFSFFAVSPDLPAEQAATTARLSLAYPLVSDPNGAAARAFRVTGSVLFLIDRDGRVRHVSNLNQTPLQGETLVAAAQSLRRSSRIPH